MAWNDAQGSGRFRARELGLSRGTLKTGPRNAITDVPGVLVGHTTVVEGDAVRTGVTAIVPRAGNLFREKVRGGLAVGNAFGKLVGATQLEELGQLETPIVLTGTLSAFRAADAVVSYMLALPGNEEVRSINPVVGETNDGFLSDGRLRPITAEHVWQAIEGARGGPVAEGCAGAGAGTVCFGWKGGIGTASRLTEVGRAAAMLGVLVQTNFGGSLRVLGAPIGEHLRPAAIRLDAGGSCMIVLGTDAPLDARQLTRLARRGVFALGRTGAAYSHGSGDYAIAFSTSPISDRSHVDDDELSPLFAAALEATEEAVLNSLFVATSTEGRDGSRVEAIPLDRVVELCRRHGIDARLPVESPGFSRRATEVEADSGSGDGGASKR